LRGQLPTPLPPFEKKLTVPCAAPSQTELLDVWRNTAELGRIEVRPHILEWDRLARFPREIWQTLGDAGLLGLPFPKAFGGSGKTAQHLAAALDGFAYGSKDLGIVNSWGVHTGMAGVAVAKFGTRDQQERYLPRMASGKIVAAFAISEPEAGSHASAIRTSALRDNNSYILSGEKAFVTNGPDADLFIITTQVESDTGPKPTAFLLERVPGLHVGPQLEKSCIRTSSINNIQMNECRVPASQRLGEEGQAFEAIVPLALNWDRAAVWGGRLGRLRSILEDSIVYASKRVQFGKPIGKHQSIGFKLADMKVRLDAAEYLLQGALKVVDEMRSDSTLIPIARLFLVLKIRRG